MAIIKCKMCGGDLALEEGSNVAECEYCGSRQTVPSADNEKKLNLFARANRLRANNEFDKASGVYESIVADFPEEAEAYWGLILCKYGIEYVDDPATGKKIPTCHRSSFDSVMDDPNFELVMEYSDPIARRVYREEAKQLEELRKGIIEVSSKEEPYDIFICYKETAEDGQRTLDSVLAQDVYDMLTENGYRVFFSRVTLEDKLGQEYEPYIFAALNSAKIMLAFGTDYDYYNAVWVKNEWSRFLQLIAKGEKKVLIPCFKNLDAYDMPKEFAKLQAQDLGKVGANQDLLRGIKKILPKEEKQSSQPIVQQIIQDGGPNVTALLDRGKMALEDKEWEKANTYFEQVLNQNAKNGKAYLGLALSTAKCSTIKAFAEYVSNRHIEEEAQTLLFPNAAQEAERVSSIAESYAVPGYLEAGKLNKMFTFSLSYPSCEQSAVENKQKAISDLQSDRNYTRAKQYSDDALKKSLSEIESKVEQAYNLRIKTAQEHAAEAKEANWNLYQTHLSEQEKKAEGLSQKARKQREKDYRYACEQLKVENSISSLQALSSLFKKLGNFEDSPIRLQTCTDLLNRAMKEKAAQEEARRQRWNAVKKELANHQMLAAGGYHTIGLKSNGAVVATKYLGEDYANQCEVDNWKDIVAIAAGSSWSVGLQADGNVIATKKLNDKFYYGESDVNGWKDIVAIAAGNIHTVGLRADGTVISTICRKHDESLYHGQDAVSGWRNIIGIAAGSWHSAGLRSDGTVVATKYIGDPESNYGQCDVSSWKDIIAIAAGSTHTVGLRKNGTVVAVGYNSNGRCNVSDWKNIVAISCGDYHTVGLREDGRVVAAGSNDNGKCNVTHWKNIVAISAGHEHTVGLREDGTVVTTNKPRYYSGQCEVGGWKLFDSLEELEQRITAIRDGRKQALYSKLAASRQRQNAAQTELSNLKGLFLGRRRKELEAEIVSLDRQIAELQKQHDAIRD